MFLFSCKKQNIQVKLKAVEFSKLHLADGIKPIPINYIILIDNKTDKEVFTKNFSLSLFLYDKEIKSKTIFNQETIKPKDSLEFKLNILDNVIYGSNLRELYENNQEFIGENFLINVVNSNIGINESLSNSKNIIKNFYLDYNKIEFEDSLKMNSGYIVPHINKEFLDNVNF